MINSRLLSQNKCYEQVGIRVSIADGAKITFEVANVDWIESNLI